MWEKLDKMKEPYRLLCVLLIFFPMFILFTLERISIYFLLAGLVYGIILTLLRWLVK